MVYCREYMVEEKMEHGDPMEIVQSEGMPATE